MIKSFCPHQALRPGPTCIQILSAFAFYFVQGASGSSGSAGTAYRLDSQDSVDDSSNSWLATRQTSISLREWDIPYEELNIGDKIGSGRFSTGKIFLLKVFYRLRHLDTLWT